VNSDRSASLPPLSRVRGGAINHSVPEAQGTALRLALCLAALTLFRLVTLAFSHTELFFDEAQYWFWSRELAFGYYSKPPLIAWIIRGATELCGQGEACIRMPSAPIHAATAMVVYAIGKQLYDARIGFWSGLIYATLPGVSLSSSLISTDAPLLFFVALSLLAVVKLQADTSWRWGVMLGFGLGFGLLSKYAMGYFLVCLVLYGIWTREGRALLKDTRVYGALAIAAALITLNLIWNANNRFATFSHTANNANWQGSLHVDEALDFITGQLGVFGPILLVSLLVFCVRWLREPQLHARAGMPERLLLAFSVPVLLLMIVQALLSRAHANWAAFAYIAATVLITAELLRGEWRRLFSGSMAAHIAVVLLIGIGGIFAGRATVAGFDPYTRVLGWKALAELAGTQARDGGFAAIATDKRALAAELLYYLRDTAIPVVAMRDDGPPSDHFEMTRPLNETTPRPVLLVSFSRDGPPASERIGSADVPAGYGKPRRVYFYALPEPPR
jgi:4-amino-4-deoxy-L-arabinose transferase-like glycosyltransferase